MLPITVLASLRMLLGTALLTTPRLTSSAFFVPYTLSSAPLLRMAGTRDIVLGALLYTNNHHTNSTRSPAGAERASSALLDSQADSASDVDGKGKLDGTDFKEARRALMAGITVDAIDVVSFLWGYGEGSLSVETLAVVMAGQ